MKNNPGLQDVQRTVLSVDDALVETAVEPLTTADNRITKIVIADDHEIFRRGLATLLNSHADWTVVAEAENGEQAIHLVEQHQPDITILDLVMPGLFDGLEATRELMRLSAKPRILILTMHASKQLVYDLLEAGARGYVMKGDAGRYLITAVETLVEGKLFFTTTVCEILLDGFLEKPALARSEKVISKRETEVLKLLAAGNSNKEIANKLNITVRTTETHRANIMNKLQFRSMSDLVRYSIRNNLDGSDKGIKDQFGSSTNVSKAIKVISNDREEPPFAN